MFAYCYSGIRCAVTNDQLSRMELFTDRDAAESRMITYSRAGEHCFLYDDRFGRLVRESFPGTVASAIPNGQFYAKDVIVFDIGGDKPVLLNIPEPDLNRPVQV